MFAPSARGRGVQGPDARRRAAREWAEVARAQYQLFRRRTKAHLRSPWHDYVDAVRLFLDGYLCRAELERVVKRCLEPKDCKDPLPFCGVGGRSAAPRPRCCGAGGPSAYWLFCVDALHNKLLLAMLRAYVVEDEETRAKSPPRKVLKAEGSDGQRRATDTSGLLSLEPIDVASVPRASHNSNASAAPGLPPAAVAAGNGVKAEVAGAAQPRRGRKRMRLPGYEVLERLLPEGRQISSAGIRLMIVACQERAKQILAASVAIRREDTSGDLGGVQATATTGFKDGAARCSQYGAAGSPASNGPATAEPKAAPSGPQGGGAAKAFKSDQRNAAAKKPAEKVEPNGKPNGKQSDGAAQSSAASSEANGAVAVAKSSAQAGASTGAGAGAPAGAAGASPDATASTSTPTSTGTGTTAGAGAKAGAGAGSTAAGAAKSTSALANASGGGPRAGAGATTSSASASQEPSVQTPQASQKATHAKSAQPVAAPRSAQATSPVVPAAKASAQPQAKAGQAQAKAKAAQAQRPGQAAKPTPPLASPAASGNAKNAANPGAKTNGPPNGNEGPKKTICASHVLEAVLRESGQKRATELRGEQLPRLRLLPHRLRYHALTHSLRLVLDRSSPDPSILELGEDPSVNAVAERRHGGTAIVEHDGRGEVRDLPLRLRVDPDHAAVVPDHLHEAVLDGELIDHVEAVDGGDVLPRPLGSHGGLHHVDELVHRVVPSHEHVALDAIFLQHLPGHVSIHALRLRHELGVAQAAAILELERDIRRRLVQPDAEAIQLMLDLELMTHGLGRVQHDEDEVARSRRADDLATSALAVSRALDDPRQVQDLDLRAAIVQGARDGRQRGELVSGRLGERAGEGRHERRLAHRGESHQSHARVAGLAHVEATASALRAAGPLGLQQLSLELGQLGLDEAQVPRGGLVLLRARILRLQICDLLLGGRHASTAPKAQSREPRDKKVHAPKRRWRAFRFGDFFERHCHWRQRRCH
eukprot:scaffold24_cov245-Pinguiococcus_pyrenoidosus.AAC.19